MAKKPKFKKKFRVLTLLFQTFFIIAFMACVVVAVGIYMKYGEQVLTLYNESQKIVASSEASDFKTSETTLVYDAEGKLLKSLIGERDSYYLESSSIPDTVKNAFISIEDKKFYQHNGIDIKRIAGSLVANIRGNSISQGGSTITQQLVKLTYLSSEQTYTRKIKEAFVSIGLEKKYTKDQILEYYINDVYFANGYYGIQAAANGYFRKGVSSLDLSQIAFLCAIPNSPTMYDPYTNKDATIERRNLILGEMLEDGYITQEEYDEAVAEKIKVKKKKSVKVGSVDSFVIDCAVKALMKQNGFEFRYSFDSDEDKDAYLVSYNESYDQYESALYTGGYKVYTSIDQNKQSLLQQAVDEQLADFTDTYGDDDVYDMQGAATCVDNSSGRVVAIVGGRTQDLEGYTLNRAFQSYRQPGSSIKPLVVYTPCLEMGYTPDTKVLDEPITDEKDAPKNAGNRYYGLITLRTGVEKSLNTIAWKVYKDVTPQNGINRLIAMHYNNISYKDYVLATAIGGLTYGTNTTEMASGFATIANEGKFSDPTCIVSILDAAGNVVVDDSVEQTEIYEQNACLTMIDILKGVLVRGTAAGQQLANNMPCAGKTGTTDENRDGWFCGFTKYYTTSVWVGYDNPKTLKALYGGSYPVRIWKTFMDQIHTDLEPKDWDAYTKTASTMDTSEVASTSEEDTEETEEEATTEKVRDENENEDTTEAPVIVTEAPVTEAPVTEAQVTEAPVTEAPVEETIVE